MFENRLADIVALIIDIRDARNFAAELVGDGGEVRGNRTAEQRETGRVVRMGVNDAADIGAVFIEIKMMREVDRGLPFTVDRFALEVGGDHVGGAHFFVIHAAGFDDDDAARAIDAAGVAAVHGDQAGAEDALIRFPDGFFERFQAHAFRVTVTIDMAGMSTRMRPLSTATECGLMVILSGSSKLLYAFISAL